MGVDPGFLGHASGPVKNPPRGGRALLTAVAGAFRPYGLNLVGATTLARYDARAPAGRALRDLVPEAHTAIVIGNGGGAFWTAYREFCRREPDHERLADPLDDFTRRVIEETARPLVGDAARILYPFRWPADPVSFMWLAECAGLGRPSLTGVLVHPVFGPWIALRAAILVADDVEAPRPDDGFDPCPGCRERACIAACPAGAVTDAGWNVPLCAAHRLQPEDACATRCHARWDCVIGREHRYPEDALAYHQQRAAASLRRRV